MNCYFLAILTSMKLVFLHGSPAVGNLTVARALLRIVSGRLFDNHAAKRRARDLHPNDSHAYTDEKAAWIRGTEAQALIWFSEQQAARRRRQVST
jgi:hypothetical protein